MIVLLVYIKFLFGDLNHSCAYIHYFNSWFVVTHDFEK